MVHRHADPDAVGAASPFSLIGDPEFYAPGGLSSLGKRLAEHVGLEFKEEVPREEVLVILDTASLSQLPNVILEGKEAYRIDHHVTGDIEPFLVDPDASSTSEVIAKVLKLKGINLPRNVAEALMAGIIYDSKAFKLAKSSTFSVMEWLSQAGSLETAFKLLESQEELDLSKRISRIKACERLVHRKVKDYVIGATYVGANEGDAARTLVQLGLDVVYVIREEKDEYRIYARCSPRILKKGFDVSELLSSIAEELGGRGGGHKGAAGAVIPKVIGLEELINKLLGRTSRRIARTLA
ncbi:hypothetical protein EYM_04950 [Ignicoccus islandicus DSM 13165]|uniref:Phosphoesterase n=1 Tax=Ignicoccus islandicus DSM 13165 TaxID=940295 RepID=A0A0U3FRP6_9CREN|nr:hypothetical protein EYM_04950 [Ignicoccus islandicus DSM 13165]